MTRWLLVPVTAAAVWYGALIAGLYGVEVLDAFCPPEQIESGMCNASWHAPAVDVLIIAMAALAAFGVVVAPAAIAPGHRFIVALSMFVLGAIVATAMAMEGGMPGPFTGAAIGGIGGLAVAAARWRRRTTS